MLRATGYLDNLLVVKTPHADYEISVSPYIRDFETPFVDILGSHSMSKAVFPAVTMCSPVLPFPN